MADSELLNLSANKTGFHGLHMGVYFDTRDDILTLISELETRGSGYDRTIKFANERMDDDPEGILAMLESTIEIARAADSLGDVATE